MAFKMKGSAFKLNNVATKSALKQVDPERKAAMDEKSKEDERKAEMDKPVKSPLEQKLNENPTAMTAGLDRGHAAGEGDHNVFGKLTRNEDEWYEKNPYMSPTADEQDIFVGKDIEETNKQYYPGEKGFKPYGGREGEKYTISQGGKLVGQREDMGGYHGNDEAYINRAKKLERERDMENQ
jgi:hypothetical protein